MQVIGLGYRVRLMGNANSNGTQPLAMMAVARKLRLQRFQIIIMRESLKSFSDSYGFVDRASFDQSLTRAKITQNQALEIFDLLFTMWDHHDVNVVPAKKFAVGIAPLACSCDDLASVLRFSLHINDENNIGKVSPKELHDVLISKSTAIFHFCFRSHLFYGTFSNFLRTTSLGIDNTASYFGDIQLEPGDIDSVVEAVFDGENGVIARERK